MSDVKRPVDIGSWTPARVIHLAFASEVEFVADLVNRLPDYEAAVEALERLLAALEGSAWAEKHRAHAAAALARLREKVPA